MVDDFKQHFMKLTFEKIPKEKNRATNAMAIIASLIDLP